MFLIKICRLLSLSLIFSAFLSSASSSSNNGSSSSNHHITKHHRSLRRCRDLDSFSNDNIRDLSQIDRKWYQDECINCQDMNNHLDDRRKSWYYTECIDCSDATRLTSSDIRNLRSTVEGWYEKKCGRNVFSNNQRNALDCSDLLDMSTSFYSSLDHNEREALKDECVRCNTWNNMSSRDKNGLITPIYLWFEDECERGNRNSGDPQTIKCSDLKTINNQEVDRLSSRVRNAYKDNCVKCSKYDAMSDSEQRYLSTTVSDWYQSRGCGNSNDLICDDLDTLDSTEIRGLRTADRIWYKSTCIKLECSDFRNGEVGYMNSQLLGMYEEECGSRSSSSSGSINTRFISCDSRDTSTMSYNEARVFFQMCGRSLDDRTYDSFTARRANGCDGCLNEANGFATCINECSRDECFADFIDVEELANCCGLSNSCKSQAESVQECFDDCLPECVETTSNNYLQCMYFFSNSRKHRCSREDCFNKIVLNRDWVDDDQLDNSRNFFENLGDKISDLQYYGGDNSDCGGAERKAEDVCLINNGCCEVCEENLSDAMDCIVNNVMRPIIGVLRSCDMDCENLIGRRLQKIGTDASSAMPMGNADLKQGSDDGGKVVKIEVEKTIDENGETITTTTKTTSVTKTTTTDIVEVTIAKDGDEASVKTANQPAISSSVVTTTTATELLNEAEDENSDTNFSVNGAEIDDDDIVINVTAINDNFDDLIDFGKDSMAMKKKTETEAVALPADECKKKLTGGFLIGNATTSSNRYLNCLIEKGTANMVSPNETEEVGEEAKPSSATSMKATALGMAIAVASLSIFSSLL